MTLRYHKKTATRRDMFLELLHELASAKSPIFGSKFNARDFLHSVDVYAIMRRRPYFFALFAAQPKSAPFNPSSATAETKSRRESRVSW